MKIYEVIKNEERSYKSDFSDFGSYKNVVAGFTKKKKAEEFVRKDKERTREEDKWNTIDKLRYHIREKRLGYKKGKPLLNIQEVEPVKDTCGLIRELYRAKMPAEQKNSLSIADVIVTENTTPHLHKWMIEFYYILEGEGKLIIDNGAFEVKKGNLTEIPKEKWHYLKGNLELLVINYPAFDRGDVIEVR